VKGSRWLLGLLLLSGFLTAAGGKAGMIEERQAVMRALADDLRGIWNGLAQGESGSMESGATQIAAQALRVLTLFPPNSFHPPSRARPAIREEFRTFEALAQNLKEAAEALAASVHQEALAGVRPHLTRLTRSCRQCHRRYIQPY
jgi:cytochrome c556